MASDNFNFRLSNDQMQHMRVEGYLVVEHLFDDAELQPVIDEISADLDQRSRKAVAAAKLSRTYEEYDFEHRLAHVDAENQEISKSMWDNKVVLPSFFGLMTKYSPAANKTTTAATTGISHLGWLTTSWMTTASSPQA